MTALTKRAHGAPDRRVKAARGLVAVAVPLYFVLCLVPGYWALIMRQLVFLAPLVFAAVSIAAIIRTAPRGDELTVWSLLGLCVAALLASESYFALYQVFVSPAGPSAPSTYDAFNLAAAIFALLAMAVASGFGRLARVPRLTFIADLLSISAVLYGALYAFWTAFLGVPDSEWLAGARWAGYSLVGVLLLAGVAWLARGARSSRQRGVAHALVVAFVVFGLQMLVSPMWQSGTLAVGSRSVSEAADSTVILFGYCAFMLAATLRISSDDGEWRAVMGRPIDTSQVWQSSLVAAVVLGGSAVMGTWAYRLPESSGERMLYVTAASVAIIAFVARTGFSTFETDALRDTSVIDPVTGAMNHRAFQEDCERQLIAGRRRGTPFVVVMLDLDGFARVNALLGHAAGDEVLRSAMVALEAAGGRQSRVYRTSGDEFSVIAAGVWERDAVTFAQGLLAALSQVEPSPGMALSASAGVVGCDGCHESKEELLKRAEAAQIWAKYHGKGRVVAYEEHIVRAIGLEERLKLDEQQTYVSVARALSAAADARDARNFYHSRNVAALSALLSEAIGLEPEHVRMIELAAMLHDVGRIAMPDPVMPAFNPGRPSRADEEHAALGAQLVESLGVEGLPAWVRGHHERWDGCGYPDGLAGSAIPLEARIIALADAYDRMTQGRRGGAPMSKSAALQEIDHGIGSRFDPSLAEMFIESVGRTVSLGWSDEWPAA